MTVLFILAGLVAGVAGIHLLQGGSTIWPILLLQMSGGFFALAGAALAS